MGFTAHTKVIAPQGMVHVKDLRPGDYVLTPLGSTKVTFCGCYSFDGYSTNVDLGVVVVGSHLMQSDVHGWLHLRSPKEDARLASLGLGSIREPLLGHELIRDDLVCTTGHKDYVEFPDDAQPKEMWVFGTEDGLAMVGGFIARTLKPLGEEFVIEADGHITKDGEWVKASGYDHQYQDTKWQYVDHSSFAPLKPLHELFRGQVIRPRAA